MRQAAQPTVPSAASLVTCILFAPTPFFRAPHPRVLKGSSSPEPRGDKTWRPAAADANFKWVSPAAEGPSPFSVTRCLQDSGIAVQPAVVRRAFARASVFLLLEEMRAAPWRHVQLRLDISASVWGQTTRNSLPPGSASPPPGGCRSPRPVHLPSLPALLQIPVEPEPRWPGDVRSNDRHRLCARPWGRCWGHTGNKAGPGRLL